MATAKGFTDYNRRYRALRYIFEFLFPISESEGVVTKNFYKIITGYLDKLNPKILDEDTKFNFVLSENIFGNADHRVFPEHNSYNTNNELWYNLIFTMYHKDDDLENNTRTEKEQRSYVKDNLLNIFNKTKKQNNKNWFEFQNGRNMFDEENIANFFRVMDKITPFSTLGFWMYLRTGQIVSSIPVIFHGSNPRIGGLQDILFQISYLIQNGKKAYINGTGPFQFKKIIYEDTSLYQEKNNPYILAACKYKSNNIIIKIYIQGDMDLIIQETARSIDGQMTLENAEKDNSVKIVDYNHEYVYDFYLITNRKDITGDYLTNKVNTEGEWYGYMDGPKRITSGYEPFIYNHFRYYGYEETKWEIIYYKFHVSEKNKISFERWTNSFGDFVYCEQRECSYSSQDNYYAFFNKKNTRTRKKYGMDKEQSKEEYEEESTNVELPTLLLPENALQNLSDGQVSFLELNWLKYTLDTFPNFSKIFLFATSLENIDKNFHTNAEQKIKQVKTNIESIVKEEKINVNELFNDPFCNFQRAPANDLGSCQPVQDIANNHVSKMLAIVKGIYDTEYRQYYRCKKWESDNTLENKEHNAVLPYAVDFDTIKYRGADKGISIMAFDLVQKRVVAIPFKDFTTGDSENESDGRIDYSYGAYDKFYYLCSYLVKLYLQDAELAEQLKEYLFDGLIKEKLKDIFSEREKGISDKKAKKLFEDSIKPWTSYTKSQMEKDITNNGNSLFTKGEINHKQKIIRLFSYLVNKESDLISKCDQIITDTICEHFIIGNTNESIYYIALKKYGTNIPDHIKDVQNKIEKLKILNEIEYINSKLKIHELLFYLKPEACVPLDIDRNIETIYDYFRNFNCARDQVNPKLNDVENEYIFKVQFEGFAYRKIQEIVLALTDLIEVPEEAKFHSYSDDKLKWIKSEQKGQSKLLRYRSKEGKEKLKAAIQKYLAEKETI